MYANICDCCGEQTYFCDRCQTSEMVWNSLVGDYRCQDCGIWEQGE